ncbi:hypothetical protein Adt_13449 [Abeliophyllum distichum]|uniref:Uncharacterized protein n=1 Tax=Abeliophyllum distichum TaxID=126358 RepID=A0ABD1TWU7_9LAMI
MGQRLTDEAIQDLDLQAALGAQMKSLNALKEFKKKVAEEEAKVAEFRAAMDSMMATVDSAKAAYEKISQDLAEAEGNVATLMKRLDDAINAQAIDSAALEKANERRSNCSCPSSLKSQP